jgi:hypothetical protein
MRVESKGTSAIERHSPINRSPKPTNTIESGRPNNWLGPSNAFYTDIRPKATRIIYFLLNVFERVTASGEPIM